MKPRPPADRLRRLIAEEAAEWFVKLQDPKTSSEERAAGARWLMRSPEHIEEYLAVSAAWGNLGELGATYDYSCEKYISEALAEPSEPTNVVRLPGIEDVVAPIEKSPVRQHHRLALAASVAAVGLLAALGWFAIDRWLHPRYDTGVGEQRIIALEDGSVIQLNTDSEVRVSFQDNQRRLRLVRGEALFKVAKDPNRPFWVSTPQATVRVIGTTFNVRLATQSTGVSVIEGRVEVIQHSEAASSASASSVAQTPAPQSHALSGSRIELAAGERAKVPEQGKIIPNEGPSVASVEGWTQRRLVFRETTLSDVIAEVNRYHKRQIRIADSETGNLRLSGTFSSDDIESLLSYLKRYRGLQVEEESDGTLVLNLIQAQPFTETHP